MDEEPTGGGLSLGGQDISCEWYDIKCHIDGVLQFFVDLLLWFPRKVVELLLDALIGVIENLPVPEAFQAALDAASGIAPGALWLINCFAVSEGAALVFGALCARFCLRRIPWIG